MKLANTKEKILDSALNFFSDNGYSGASIRQIARSIGIRESAIYNHYKSKEEIFLAILARYKTKNIGKAVLSDELLDEVVNPEIFLGKFALRLFEQWGRPDEIKFIRLLLMEQFTNIGNKELSVADYLAETLKICELIFAEMIKNGIIKKTDPALLAFEFTAPLFLIRTEHLSAENHKSKSAAAAGVNNHVSFFWNAIKID
jgi:AcrR family transcriptional regulator